MPNTQEPTASVTTNSKEGTALAYPFWCSSSPCRPRTSTYSGSDIGIRLEIGSCAVASRHAERGWTIRISRRNDFFFH
eukprot:scaffold149383_cov48-Attheya_sp.AAC.4